MEHIYRSGVVRFVDLFAGMGGMRLALEEAARGLGLQAKCVLTSEIKPAAVRALRENWPGEEITGDVRVVAAGDVPPFDVLLGGFPCQAFSYAGLRRGFDDTRGTLFFEIARLLASHRPRLAVMENVEGLVTHDRVPNDMKIGRTLKTILDTLRELGYSVSWRVLDAQDFGLAQRRKRIYIVAHLGAAVSLGSFARRTPSKLKDVLEHNVPTEESEFTRRVLSCYSVGEVVGKAFKDKRGGADNIHSWDLGLNGEVSDTQRQLMDTIVRSRRNKRWAAEYGIDWMDGMPMTGEQIASVFSHEELEAMLSDLVEKQYLKLEHPKRLVRERGGDGKVRLRRVQDVMLPLGYNIVAGKLSFPISAVLSPEAVAPTLVATDMDRLYVPDGETIRQLTLREGLRLFGYPEEYRLNEPHRQGYDLLGNTVAIPVVRAVCERGLEAMVKEGDF